MSKPNQPIHERRFTERKNTGQRFAELGPGDEPTDEQLADLMRMVGDDVRARIAETDRKFWAELNRLIAKQEETHHE
jgi:arsenate reductase-like glutaredoxin family protein